MTQVISFVAPPKVTTPAHSPMELDDYEAPRASGAATTDTPDSPSPYTSSLVRKRAVSINTAEANFSRLEQLRINSPNIMNADTPRDLICLCTPVPKIPRPRNAFILYRQHHQAHVVAQNPSLSNPDISKIIGEKWKEESDEVKNNWKSLADEEKLRHQRQYPDYRYQPRRGTKGQVNKPGTSPSEDYGRCPKCNGRSIATPRTPSTPFATPTAAKSGMNPYPSGLRGEEGEIVRRGSFGGMPINRQRLLAQRPAYQEEMEDLDLESPELKRRRFNSAGNYHMITSPGMPHEAYGGKPSAHPMRTASIGGHQLSVRQYGGPALLESGSLPRSKSGPMPPPPRPLVSGPWGEPTHHSGRHGSFDESLRLPPLQTSIPMSPSVGNEVDMRHVNTPVVDQNVTADSNSQAKSVEAMVMSIPFTRKLAVLGNINRPLVPPAPGSPTVDTRGAIIAVEGPKPRLLQRVGEVIENALLTASDEVALKTWGNHSFADCEALLSDGNRALGRADSEAFFMKYFQTMLKWHEKSLEIVEHVTSRAESTNRALKDGDEEETKNSRETETPEANKESSKKGKTPVALLKEGFSLTLSDAFACSTPIGDAYAPVDHWQWMATLWRGIVGPDLVVYVKPSVEDEINRFGTVDFQRRQGLVVVRVAVGKDLDEATERRVAFEVIEWMRGGSFREGFDKA